MSLCEISFPASDILFPLCDISFPRRDILFLLCGMSFLLIVLVYRHGIVKYTYTSPKIIYDNDESSSLPSQLFEMVSGELRYHGRWIDSVWKSRSHADALKENPINLNIF